MTDTPNNDEMVQIPQKQLDDLLQRVAALESGAPPILEKVKNHKVRIRFIDGEPVLGWTAKGVYEEYAAHDIQHRDPILFIDLIVKGKKDAVKMRYLDFKDVPQQELDILKEDKQEVAKRDGYINKKEFDGNYGMTETDVRVPVEVTSDKRTFTIALPNGEELIISEDYVNS